jgi:hypothetical protein
MFDMYQNNNAIAKLRQSTRLGRSGFQVSNSLRPRKLLIYYGTPWSFNKINNNNNKENVARDMAQYDDIILGVGIESETHSAHNQAVHIIQRVSQINRRVKFYGYIPLGMLNWNSKYDIDEVKNRINKWKRIGAKGIYFNEFGYDYGVTRERQNAAVSYAKENGLQVAVNGWNPDQIFGSDFNIINNSNSADTVLGEGDFYLMEGYAIKEGKYDSYNNLNWKQNSVNMYRNKLNFGVWSVTTNSLERATMYNEDDANKWNYAWYLALINGHNSVGWGEYLFSCCEPNNDMSSFHPRPNSNIGSRFTSNIISTLENGDTILTRNTDTGRITVNTTKHTAMFEPYNS